MSEIAGKRSETSSDALHDVVVDAAEDRPLVEVRNLAKRFSVRRGLLQRVTGEVRAVDGVDLDLWPGECFALVGESGSGKTTLGRCLVRLLDPDAGEIRFDGEDLLALSGRELRRRRRRFQMVFQDPYGSLDPRMRVGRTLTEPLAVHDVVPKERRPARVARLLEQVGLPADAARRYPHAFSGGQRQRVGIARALATEPDLLVADEPVSALDVSVQAQIINLLSRLQDELGLTLVFIAHDLSVVEHIAHRVAVMYLGRIVELADRKTLFGSPRHPYTVSLLSAVPVPEVGRRKQRIVLPGELPSPVEPPPGCPFHPRCPIARPRCAEERPPLAPMAAASGGEDGAQEAARVACFYPGEMEMPESAASTGSRVSGGSSDGSSAGAAGLEL
jgi:oligopeptide/dipeptide ABC transporter ATP-binding protein